MNPISRLLLTAYRHRIVEATPEDGLARLAEYAREPDTDFRDAVAACLRNGLIRDPVRLREGALQCHWRLELTEEGEAEARTLLGSGST